MATNTPNKNQRKGQAAVRIGLMVAILICVNVLASYIHSGIDLTQEKRFTLTQPTKTLLRGMRETAVIDVYLKGKFPAEIQRMQEAVRERLASFKDIAGSKLIVRFSDPFEGKNDKEQKQVAREMHEKGMRVLELSAQEDEEFLSKPFFPYALVQYNGREMPIYLLDNPFGNAGAAEKVNYAESQLEYKFANAINQLSKPQRTSIAYIIGNGEDYGMKTLDMLLTLPNIYNLDTIDLKHVTYIPNAYDAIIINRPTEPFSGPDKLKIDQYIMRGGHILWNINSMHATLDSLQHSPQFISMEYGLDLDDLLYRYGVRINNDIIEDMQCARLPRVVEGGKPQLFNWIYFPVFNPTVDHPIVKNMDFILGQFSNSIDTIRSAEIKKTILLQSSKYSRIARSPVRISLSMMSYPLRNEMFNNPYKPTAVLLEGKFASAYRGRLAPEYLRVLDSIRFPFKPICDSGNRMIVASIGDVFSSDYNQKDGIIPMGYYKYEQQFYANKNFLLNCLEYLTDRSGVLEARSKDVKLRLLDVARAKNEKSTWQVVNVGIPIALVLIFASVYLFIRKRRYEEKTAVKPSSENA